MPSHSYRPPPQYQPSPELSSTAVLTSVLASLFILYAFLIHLSILPSPLHLLLTMTSRFLPPAARESIESNFTLRSSPLSRLAPHLTSSLSSSSPGVPGGIWNTGNTCYQNSVLQALASLPTLTPYLTSLPASDSPTSAALTHLIASLNTIQHGGQTQSLDSAITGHGGKSWGYNEQQDAQEFLQSLLHILEKEHTAYTTSLRESGKIGIEAALLPPQTNPSPIDPNALPASPFEGLLAQRVGCLTCKYVESISLSPFVTLSLPMPQFSQTTIMECLQAYVAMEHIPQVECDKCTLFTHRRKLLTMLEKPDTPPEIVSTIRARLTALEHAIDNDDFAAEVPGFNKRHKTLATKTKQVMISRTPQILALHANRSVYDPMSGSIMKNHAPIGYPMRLDLGRIGVLTRFEDINLDPAVKMSPPVPEGEVEGEGKESEEVFELRSVVCHFGGHHNGHYITYRKWAGKWWRISDHEVYETTEDQVLESGNAFMVFYERLSPEADAASGALNTPVVLEKPQKTETDEAETEADAATETTTTMGLVTPPPEGVEVAEEGEKVARAKVEVRETEKERRRENELTLEMMTPPPEETTEVEAGEVVSPPGSVAGSIGTSGSGKARKRKGKRKGDAGQGKVAEPVS